MNEAMRNPETGSRTSHTGSIIGPTMLEPRKGPREIYVAKFRLDTAYDTKIFPLPLAGEGQGEGSRSPVKRLLSA